MGYQCIAKHFVNICSWRIIWNIFDMCDTVVTLPFPICVFNTSQYGCQNNIRIKMAMVAATNRRQGFD